MKPISWINRISEMLSNGAKSIKAVLRDTRIPLDPLAHYMHIHKSSVMLSLQGVEI